MGRIITNSVSDEPFDADIVIEDAPAALRKEQIKVKLASRAEYQELGLSVESYHQDLTFTPYKKNKNDWYIKVKSNYPFNKQFVNFLISVDYPNGRSVREYMAILQNSIEKPSVGASSHAFSNDYSLATTEDNNKIVRMADSASVEATNAAPAAATETSKPIVTYSKDIEEKDNLVAEATRPSKALENPTTNVVADNNMKSNIHVVEQTKTNPIVTNVIKEESTLTKDIKNEQEITANRAVSPLKEDTNTLDISAPADLTHSIDSDNETTRTITAANKIIVAKNGDTLWNIAKQYTSNPIDTSKMVVAIYNNNRRAFVNNNVNLLKSGAKLNIPQQANLKLITNKNVHELLSNKRKIARAIHNEVLPTSLTTEASMLETTVLDNNKSNIVVEPSTDKKTQQTKKNSTIDKTAVLNNSKANDLVTLSSIEEDLAKSKTRIAKNNTQQLKIVAAEGLKQNPSNQLMLSAEKLVSRQKENQELKEQVLILQAQVRDMRKLLELKKEGTARATSEISQIDTAISAKNPLVPTHLQTANKVGQSQQAIANSADALALTDQSRTINSNPQDAQASKSSITSYLGSKVAALSRMGSNATGIESKALFWIFFIGAAGLSALASIYYYWQRYYKMQPITHNFMSDVSESEILETVENEFVMEDILVKNHGHVIHNEISANFDLVKAYIELDDYITAKKILNEILQNGDNEHKKEANKILDSIPA